MTLLLGDFFQTKKYIVHHPKSGKPVNITTVEPIKVLAYRFDEERFQQKLDMLADLADRYENDPSIDMYEEAGKIMRIDCMKLTCK